MAMIYLTGVKGIGFALLLLCSTAYAQADPGDNAFGDIAGRWYVSPMYSVIWADGRRATDDGGGLTAAVGKNVNRYFNLELYGFHTEYDASEPGARSAKIEGLGIAAYGFPFGRHPGRLGAALGGAYGLVGVGFGESRHFPSREGLFDANGTRFILDAGLGYLARIPFVRLASLRLDLRYRLDIDRHPFKSVDNDQENDDPEFGDFLFSAGLVIPLGARPPPTPPPEQLNPRVVSPVADDPTTQ